jgi:phage head maturation protease
MLRFEMDVLAADLLARTIEGVIVPYGEAARPHGAPFPLRFAPGSIRAARARTPLLVDHDRGRPVGVLAELVDGPTGAFATFRVDATPAGDEALTQAASGSRGSFSIGADLVGPIRAGADGVGDVDGSGVYASVLEVSLLAFGAYAGAEVTRVAAEEPDDDVDDPDDDDDDDDDDPDPDPDPDAGAAAVHPEQEALPMEATLDPARPAILAERTPAPRDLGAGELVHYIIRAQHGERDALRYLEAALVESVSTDVSGLLPPTYERTVIGGKDTARPLYELFRSRPLPGVGLLVSKPNWTTRPDGEWAADVDADATSTKIAIGAQQATVQRWDWAGAFPWVVVQRSDPSLIDEVYAEAVQDWYLDVEAKIYAELSAAAPGVAASLGAAIAEFYVATGKERAPDVIIMAPDVWGSFADAGLMSTSVGSGGVDGPTLSTSFAGIRAMTVGTLPAGEVILATRRAVDARVTEPVRLTANAIGALNVELAVVGEGLFDTDYPAELLKFAAITPPAGLMMGGSSARRSS